MIGHLGVRVSALLDGRLPSAEEERAWEHVHLCHPCRDLVEREGWVKTRLAGLRHCSPSATPSMEESLRRSLLRLAPDGASRMHEHVPRSVECASPRPRARHLVGIGGGAVGVAVVGVLALGAMPADAPVSDRRGPVTSLVPPSPSPDRRPGNNAPTRPASVLIEGFHATLVP